jgi:alpha-beta hydrolase superfamily lysophospholipase
MTHHPLPFAGAGQLALHGQCWVPDSTPPRAVVVIVHGIGEHSGRYQNLVAPLVAAGLAVAAHDLRGHGQSGGIRGHLIHRQELFEDLHGFLALVRSRFPDRPVFLYGHSLGSIIVLGYLRAHPDPFAGIVLSGTATRPVGIARPHLVAIARLLSRFWPTFPVPLPATAPAGLSRNPEVERAFRADPLNLAAVTARFGTEALALVAEAPAVADLLRWPLLMVHGAADPLNTLAGAQEFFERAASPDKRLLIYPDCLHEVHHERSHLQLASDLVAWIEPRCSDRREEIDLPTP